MSFVNVTVSALLQGKALYVAQATDDIQQVLNILNTNNILSVPIFSADKVLGILSVMDIAVFLTWGSDVLTQHRSLSMRAGDILGFWSSTKDVFSLYPDDFPLLRIMEPFSNGSHRVLVTTGNTFNVLSQTDVVKYLFNNLSEFQTISQKSLHDLGIKEKPVISLDYTQNAINGFRKMIESKVQAVAIVENQKLTENLSGSDLRGLTPDKLSLLYTPVRQFLQTHRGVIRPAITISIQSTLEQAMKIIISNSIHRLWITNDQGEPKGCLSLTDIIQIFITQ